MVVIREFHDPSAELAWAAIGRATRSWDSARSSSWAERDDDVPGAWANAKVGQGPFHVHAGLSGQDFPLFESHTH